MRGSFGKVTRLEQGVGGGGGAVADAGRYLLRSAVDSLCRVWFPSWWGGEQLWMEA